MTTITLIDRTTSQTPQATAWDARCSLLAAWLDQRLEPRGWGCVFYLSAKRLGSGAPWWAVSLQKLARGRRPGSTWVLQVGRWELVRD